MSKRLFVGSLPLSLDDEGLRQIFIRMGKVVYAKVIKNKETGLSRGYGFVEMASKEEGERAMQGLLDTIIEGRKIIVSEAWERKDKHIGDNKYDKS